jgi:membrane fusion protein (multidrug efflux system)
VRPTVRVAAAIAVLSTLAACSKKEAPKALPPEVLFATVTQEDVPIGVEAVGQTRGSEEVEIRPRISGYLTSLNFTEGTPVKKGQLLYVIDEAPFKASVAQLRGTLAEAQAQLTKAKQDVARYKPLVEQKAVSKMELDNAEAAEMTASGSVASAKGALQKAEVDLAYCRIMSPTDGVAGISTVSVGNLVGPADAKALTTVSKVDPIWVKISIPEVQYLELAQRVAARSKSDTAKRPIEMVLANGQVFPHPGKFRAIDARTDATTGTVSIDVAFPNPDRILRAGQFARIRSVSQTLKGALVIPSRALQDLQGTSRVAQIGAGDTIHMKVVKTGPVSGPMTVIAEGLAAGDRVVVEGLQRVRDGVVVRATPAPPAADSTAQPGAASGAPAAPPAPGAAPAAADSTKKPATP